MEDLKFKIIKFQEETKVYFDMLSKLEMLKQVKYLYNTEINELTPLKQDDILTEIKIKQIIEDIKEKYFPNNSNAVI
jgi:hypothetical protein